MARFTEKLIFRVVIALFLSLALVESHAGEKPWVPGRLLVKPASGVSLNTLDTLLDQLGGRRSSQLRNLAVHIVEVPVNAETALAEALANNPQIEFAEPDYLYTLQATTANDSYYENAWHLATIHAPEAWDTSLGDSIVVAVLDTGVDASHPDLQGQLLSGWNSYDNNSDTSDVHGHGTMVSGVVAALSNNNLGVTSIAWNARILPVRVSGPTGTAYSSTIANGLTWAADHGADVANISYAVSGSATIKNAANYLRSKGGLVFVSAGNNGSELGTAPDSAIITVSATTSSDTLAGWSNYGDVIDLSAPGAGIWTTTRGGGYSAVSGTSFSSPAGAAVAALVMAVDPSRSADEVESLLKQYSTDLGSPGQDIYFGYGRVDAAAAVAAALGGAAGDPPADTQNPVVSITSPTGGTVSGQITVSIDASDDTSVSYVELYAGPSLIGTDGSSPYQIGWNTESEADGPLQLTARAYDLAGNQGTSDAVNVEVSNPTPVEDTEPPSITILSPSDTSTTVSGRVKIKVTASDNVGVIRIELYVDNTLDKVSNTDTLDYRWDTRKMSDGLHEVMAVAYDAADNSSSLVRQVTIDNGSSSNTGGDTGGGTGGGSGSQGWGKGGKPK